MYICVCMLLARWRGGDCLEAGPAIHSLHGPRTVTSLPRLRCLASSSAKSDRPWGRRASLGWRQREVRHRGLQHHPADEMKMPPRPQPEEEQLSVHSAAVLHTHLRLGATRRRTVGSQKAKLCDGFIKAVLKVHLLFRCIVEARWIFLAHALLDYCHIY